MRFLIMLSLFLLPLSAFAQATPAWALEPDRYENINRTWSASPQGNGKTVYSDGLNFIEVAPSGFNSFSYNAWSADGTNTVGTIYGAPRSEPPQPSLYERFERAVDPSTGSPYSTERRR